MKSVPRSVSMRPLPLFLLLLAAPVWAAPPGVTVSWTPERVVLGQDSQVTVEVRVPPGSGPVRGAASSGAFSQQRVEGGEVRAFQWTPPPVRHPLVAVLAFWLEGGAELPPEWAVVRIPLLGKTQLDVTTDAEASVVVEVAGRRFGPVQADERSRARVPVEVPPGVRSATVLATRDTLRTRAVIPLDAPEDAPLVAALTPSPLPEEAGGWLLVAGEEGLGPEELEVSAEGATCVYDGEAFRESAVEISTDGAEVSAARLRQGAGALSPAGTPPSARQGPSMASSSGDTAPPVGEGPRARGHMSPVVDTTKSAEAGSRSRGRARPTGPRPGPQTSLTVITTAPGESPLPERAPEPTLRFRVTPKPGATTVSVTVRRKEREDRARATADVLAKPAPVVATTTPPPIAPLVVPVPPPPPVHVVPPSPWRASVFALAGGAFASGANTGPTGSVGVSLAPPWWEGRFAAELEAGLRGATFDGRVDSLGGVRSRVLAVPVLASVRAVIFQRAAFSLYGRAGGGLLPFRHQLRSDFQEDLKESKLAGMGFLSAQAAYRFGRWSALAEVRGAWAPARTPWLDAQLGGLSGLLGVRFEP